MVLYLSGSGRQYCTSYGKEMLSTETEEAKSIGIFSVNMLTNDATQTKLLGQLLH